MAQKGDDDGIHAYVIEAQRLTTTQRNVRVATKPAEFEGKKIQPGNLVVMMLVSFLPFLIILHTKAANPIYHSKGRGRTQRV